MPGKLGGLAPGADAFDALPGVKQLSACLRRQAGPDERPLASSSSPEEDDLIKLLVEEIPLVLSEGWSRHIMK